MVDLNIVFNVSFKFEIMMKRFLIKIKNCLNCIFINKIYTNITFNNIS
jgi:hypothetical protein